MIEQDTIRLLRECDAGVKMGVSSIDDVLSHIENDGLKHYLEACSQEHERLGAEIQTQLARFSDEGKDPNPVAKGMSWLKTNMKLGMKNTDATVADLMIDGCDMGVKSLSKYLNQYAAADEKSKDLTKRLIGLEEKMSVEMRQYL